MTIRTKAIAAVSAAAMALASTGAVAAVFSDVPANHWAKPGIDWASQNGIMTGPGNMPGRFDPAGWVNRAQLATVMHRMDEMHTEEVLDLRNIVEQLEERVEDLEERLEEMEDELDDATTSRRSSSSSSRNSSGMSSSRSSMSSSMSSSPSSMSASSVSSMSASSGQSSSFSS